MVILDNPYPSKFQNPFALSPNSHHGPIFFKSASHQLPLPSFLVLTPVELPPLNVSLILQIHYFKPANKKNPQKKNHLLKVKSNSKSMVQKNLANATVFELKEFIVAGVVLCFVQREHKREEWDHVLKEFI